MTKVKVQDDLAHAWNGDTKVPKEGGVSMYDGQTLFRLSAPTFRKQPGAGHRTRWAKSPRRVGSLPHFDDFSLVDTARPRGRVGWKVAPWLKHHGG